MSGESRRDFLIAVIGLWQAASLRAQEQRRTTGINSKQHQTATFLDGRQREILRRLIDRIVPADKRSAGATGARVDEYVDFVLFHADPTLQAEWRKGLERYGAAIADKNADGIDEFLADQAHREFAPQTENERFFVYLKTAVTEGFYTSEEGISKELGYKGMTFQMDFPGCTHPEHKVPAGYKPLLRWSDKA
jgi:hypothetical protein